MTRALKAGDAAQGEKAADRLGAIENSVSLGSRDDLEIAQIKKLTSLTRLEPMTNANSSTTDYVPAGRGVGVRASLG